MTAPYEENRDPVCWTWEIPAVAIPTDTLGQLRMLKMWQAGRCGICGEYATCEDHDHVTGLTRGWLCSNCNNREGRLSPPDSVFARWRACPASAVLGVHIEYGPPDPLRDWTGPTFLPEWAPPHHGWPHAHTISKRAVPDIPEFFLDAARAMDDEWVRITNESPSVE